VIEVIRRRKSTTDYGLRTTDHGPPFAFCIFNFEFARMESHRKTEIVVLTPTYYLLVALKRRLVDFEGIEVLDIKYDEPVGRLTVSHTVNPEMLVDEILDMAEDLRLLIKRVGPEKVELRYLAFEGGPGWGDPRFMLD